MTRVTRRGLGLAIPALIGSGHALAQGAGWRPTGNVEMIVGAGPGGENDRVARGIQRALQLEGLVTNMSIVNRPGAGQTVAMNYLGTKQRDPHTLAIASGSYINSIARSGATPHRDRFEPLVRLFDSPQAYFVRADSPFRTARDVLERLRSNPASLTFAFSVGLGSPLHVSVVQFGKLAGVAPRNMKTVVFESGTEVAAQLAGGHVDVTISSTGSGLGLVQAGNIRFLGICYHERLGGVLADVPTMREQGVDLITTTSYQVLMPRGLSAEQINFWKAAMARVLENAEFKADLERNFWPARPVFHPDAQAPFNAEYDETRAILIELGFAR